MLVFLYYRIHEALLAWFESFLTRRHQTGIWEEGASNASLINCGIPQGTILGPLIFLMYVNDLPNWLHSKVKLFADGAWWYGILTNDANCNQLQEYLHKLEEWQHRWQIKFNPSNGKLYESQRNKIHQWESIHFVELNLIKLNLSRIYNVGVIISSNVKWFQHTASWMKKCK